MRILLAEDDGMLGDGLQTGLRQLGFQVDWVLDGRTAELEIASGSYAAAVLDLGLPLKNGMDVLKDLRARKIATPVLILTARDAVPDRIAGLNLGADDYVVKPVNLHELAARLHALVRRSHGVAGDVLRCGPVLLDTASREVRYDGQAVTLSMREFDLLHALMLRPGRILSREQLEQWLYAAGREVESNTIEVHIHFLRRKLYPEMIRTVRGVGYMVARDEAAP
ncbi:MAG: DNA-binding response regulator [Polaromonas sp. 39-63-203]|jgi:two-component system OmpR family response regulator/two-component system response regulator QseB|uniref:winged helix-turn-helix domain-containing protein n=1 Tax=Polaromonas sp. TaxID=1869339 RepID=UPI000BD52C48|nr:response regulator transcription factor [Polaromonas sp.]OYY52712.1 MAG: DNA-binding response regulator [Polaromonas sp. 35-63-240]OYY96457.1 MAG: DNA-binding response regulator [Polaromonas sp. 28-63-22]OYZ84375.1 MAG: DNA-binding response regulator [Polaromonas sp. 24-62-144]OZA98632.1 MAG: DNA-binding response regulator [Polaromonas sp. 39-63-203]HQS32484.1 response regulator transcription factor [Polaromonas sp.]